MKKLFRNIFICLALVGGLTLMGCVINIGDQEPGTLRLINRSSAPIVYISIEGPDDQEVYLNDFLDRNETFDSKDLQPGNYVVYVEDDLGDGGETSFTIRSGRMTTIEYPGEFEEIYLMPLNQEIVE
jgi:hypothetical protein